MFSWQLIKEVVKAVYQHIMHNLICLGFYNYVVDQCMLKTVQGLADYAQELTYYSSLVAPDPLLTL